MGHVAQAAQETNTSALSLQKAADELSKLSTGLESLVGRFNMNGNAAAHA
jgi:methyl-accepting chemotaxis protein